MNEAAPQGRELALSLRDVGVSYWLRAGLFSRRRFWAFHDVSFDLYRGDSLAVIGVNGAGKSTLVRLLAGVMSPDKGTLVNHGVSTALLSLNLGFTPYLTGRENAVLGGMFQGMRKEEVESKLDEIIEFAQLDEFIDQPISTYSSGMLARLGFAVAFQVQPDVLLVDEVLGVGDAKFQAKSKALMKERIKSENSTVVIVTHVQDLIRDICNRVLWIEDHVVQSIGDVEPVLQEYAEFLRSGVKKVRA